MMPIDVIWVFIKYYLGWGGSCRGGVGHAWVGWVIQGWGGSCRGGVGHIGVGWGGSCRGRVGHSGVNG